MKQLSELKGGQKFVFPGGTHDYMVLYDPRGTRY